MYSGTTLTRFSGCIIGAHQKIDRVARKHLAPLLPHGHASFPQTREILTFEGRNGPDAIKRKSPAQNEPWHYLNPYDATDTQLCDLITEHHHNLTRALVAGDTTKAAFEAAWLAHAIVDGLTPAHHHDYEGELEKLRGGEGKHTRKTLKEKLIMHGSTAPEKIANNWKMWGPKGLMSTHGLFEMGVATIIAPLMLASARPTIAQLQEVESDGIVEYFKRRAKEIYAMGLYAQYYKTGWTPSLARKIRKQLAPMIVTTVTLAWYSAALQSARETMA